MIAEEAQKSDPQLLTTILMNSVKGFMNSLVHEINNEKDYPKLETQAIDFMMNGIRKLNQCTLVEGCTVVYNES